MNEIQVTRPPSRHPRRLVALGGVTAVVLVAVAVAVTSGGAASHGPGALPPLPGPPATSAGAAAAAGPAVSSAGPAAAGLAGGPAVSSAGPAGYQWPGQVTALPARSPAYRLDPRVATAPVTALALALGLHGSVQAGPSAWSVTDGTARLQVAQADGRWSYSAAAPSSCVGIAAVNGATGGIVCAGGAGVGSAVSSGAATVLPAQTTTVDGSGAVGSRPGSPVPAPGTTLVPVTGCPRPPCPAGTMCPDICGPVRPTADLPSVQQAGQDVRAVLARAGIDATGADLTSSATLWAVSVGVNPRVGGLPTLGLASSFTLGAKGTIQFASGWLAAPAKLADYPLVGSAAGFARLQADRDVLWGGYEGVVFRGGSAPAAPVVVTGPRLGLVTVRGFQGGYLEPAYIFDLAQSGQLSPAVAAVPDGDLQTVDPGGPLRSVVPPAPAPATFVPGGSRPATSPHPAASPSS